MRVYLGWVAWCLKHRAATVLASLALFAGWAVIGLVVYFTYSRHHSHVGRGLVEVHEGDADIPPQPVPPMPGASLD